MKNPGTFFSTSFTSKTIQKQPVPVIEANKFIEENKVELNRRNKLFGSFGETIVVFHNATSPLGVFIDTFQAELLKRFCKASQNVEQGLFVNENDSSANSISFVPISNPHTTVIAMRVIDAYDKNSWDERLIQTYLYAKLTQYQPEEDEISVINTGKLLILEQFNLEEFINMVPISILRKALGFQDEHISIFNYILLQSHVSLISYPLEQIIVNKIQSNPEVVLEIESISLNANGSLGIKWSINDDIISLRKLLSQIGGVAKHGDNIITTTIGYFPYCKEDCRNEIKQTLENIIIEMNTETTPTTKYLVDLKEMQLVKFARNDLCRDFITTTTLLDHGHLSTKENQDEFPNFSSML